MDDLSSAYPLSRVLDDVDKQYIAEQLIDDTLEPVRLRVVGLCSRSTLLSREQPANPDTTSATREMARLVAELVEIVPGLSTETRYWEAGTEEPGSQALPRLEVEATGGTGVAFVGLPRANLFRALLETIRRASTRDYGLAEDLVRTLGSLPGAVHLRLFATPT